MLMLTLPTCLLFRGAQPAPLLLGLLVEAEVGLVHLLQALLRPVHGLGAARQVREHHARRKRAVRRGHPGAVVRFWTEQLVIQDAANMKRISRKLLNHFMK